MDLLFNPFPDGEIYANSVISEGDTSFALVKLNGNAGKRLIVQGDQAGFEGEPHGELWACRLTTANAAALRSRISWLNPVPLRRQTSFGFGDRLGSATPGHIMALCSVDPGTSIAPIFAQQSVRENTRTGRTPQEVLDDAMWGVFQEGWRGHWGADADHVKEISDLAPFVAAGYTFYTIDPSDYVDNEADSDSLDELNQKAAQLPWQRFGTSYEAMKAHYFDAQLPAGVVFDEDALLRALVKYGPAVIHTADIAAALDESMASYGYDLEMSIDETETPTSIAEHYFIANELHVRNIPVVSLAPRFVGKFQKGVDYIGDIKEFETELARHMAILHHFDSYKISIHTGSDKFSIYDNINAQAHGYVHVKTAGTSYLEALRIVTGLNPTLFRQMLDLAHQRFETDKKTYFLDCQPDKVPASDQLTDAQLPELLEQFDSRQLLHVTYGSILDEFGRELHTLLSEYEDAYKAGLNTHFGRHLRPFC